MKLSFKKLDKSLHSTFWWGYEKDANENEWMVTDVEKENDFWDSSWLGPYANFLPFYYIIA